MWWSPFVSHHKPKLQVNIQTGKWHCWVSNQGGHNLFQLLKQVNANRSLFKELSDAVGSTFYTSDKKDKKDIVLNLPKEAKPLYDESESVQKLHALKFLYERGLSDEDILRYNLHYCLSGVYQNRIIIPSYDSDGVLNYFVGRDFYRGGMKYKNHPIPKDIIGFDLYIDWSQPIVLCEGVFDAIAIKNNSIPLFGKTIQSKLEKEIYKQSVKKIYVVLDDDAKTDALKITSKLMENGINVYFVHMKDKDPSAIGFERMTHRIKTTRQMNLKSFLANKLFTNKKKFIDI